MEIAFYDQFSHDFLKLQQINRSRFVWQSVASVCETEHAFSSNPALCLDDTFSRDSFCEMLRHIDLFTWRREATATSEINPFWARMSHANTHTHAPMCWRLGCAAQSKWIRHRLIWLGPVAIWDWDDKAMISTSLTVTRIWTFNQMDRRFRVQQIALCTFAPLKYFYFTSQHAAVTGNSISWICLNTKECTSLTDVFNIMQNL